MLEQLPTLVKLIKSLQQVPYLASKNLYKVTAHFLNMNEQQIKQFCQILLQSKTKLIKCKSCHCWQEVEHSCLFCGDPKRDKSLVCVVETWQEIIAIEKTRGYTGVYHVLGGVISPLEGIGPEDLAIDSLISRIESGTVNEIILATNQTPEGEATAAFIAKKLKNKDVLVSCLARGLPVGSSLETMDRLTVYKALSERRPY